MASLSARKYDNHFYGVSYKPLSENEKSSIEVILATGNLTIEMLSNRSEMKWERRDIYRRCIINNNFEECTLSEKQMCLSLTLKEVQAIKRIEENKFRLLEGFVARLVQLVSRKVRLAKWFDHVDNHTMRRDLSSEATAAFLHAVWRFNRYDIKFNTFMTTVVNNWLTEYCEKLSPIRLSEDLKGLLITYYNIRNSERMACRFPSFEDIVNIIIQNQLRDAGIAATERNIKASFEQQREKFIELQQATRQILSTHPNTKCFSTSKDLDALIEEYSENLTDIEKRIFLHKIHGGTVLEFAKNESIDRHQASKVLNRVRSIIVD